MFRIVKRRNGRTVRIPVDEYGYVPIEALHARQAERHPRSQIIDGMQTHRTVRPLRLTPEQAASWWLYPGRSDIAGIDAPEDAVITMRTQVDRHDHSGKAKRQPKGTRRMTAKEAKQYDTLISDIRFHCQVTEYELLKENGRNVIRFPLISEVNGVRMPNADLEHYYGFYDIQTDPTGMVFTIDLDSPYASQINANRRAVKVVSQNPKRDVQPAFASAETGKEYGFTPTGLKKYARDVAEWSDINQAGLVRMIKSNLAPVPGAVLDIDIDGFSDSLEVLYR